MTRVAPATADTLREAARILREGGLVAFPTETVYGLGARADDAAAVRRVFEAKGRPADNPLIVHVATAEAAEALAAAFPPAARRLADRFWPGPLTLVVARAADTGIPDEVTAGLPSIAVRVPGHTVALDLLREAGVPVAAPSANRSGSPSPTRADHVAHDLGDALDLVVDGGPCQVGVESTVVDVRGEQPRLLRPGGVTLPQLEETVGGPVDVHPGVLTALRAADLAESPGMKYRHYAPGAPLVLFEGPPGARVEALRRERDARAARGERVALLVTAESGLEGPDAVVLGPRTDPREMAARLFAALRDLDARDPDVILAEGVEPEGMGLALANRLRKAADHAVTVGADSQTL